MTTPRRTSPDPQRRATPRRARVAAALAVVTTGALLLAACGGSYSATPVHTSTTGSGGAHDATAGPDPAPAVPTTGAYLGAWLHPSEPVTGQSSFAVEQGAVPKVLAATGRPLGLLHIYAPWARPAPVTELRAVVADGSVPILDWGCGPDVSGLSGGADDALITAYATALKDFGGPVFLRWCWEMNLVASHPQVGGPAAFVSAWDHIRTLFRQAGATNVSFVWCPALSGVDPTPYFPGADEVDWIGVDGYDHDGTQTFATLFSAFVDEWQGQGKPLMVAETGAAGDAQPGYIDSIATDAPTLPAVKAVVYFDARGPLATWQFTPAGLEAFAHLAGDPYFHPQ